MLRSSPKGLQSPSGRRLAIIGGRLTLGPTAHLSRFFCERLRLPRQKGNSIVNKGTLQLGRTGSSACNSPSGGITTIERTRRIAPERFDEILGSYLVESASLRSYGWRGASWT